MNDSENKSKKIAVRLPPALYERVIAKAKRESVNLSALLRAKLKEWAETEKGVSSCQDH